MRIIENGLRLIHDDSTDLINLEKIRSETIIQLLNIHGYEVKNLRDSLEKTSQNVRSIYSKYF